MTMYLSRITLQNWERFRGEHVLELGRKPYAIVARHADNPEHSNFLGKSSFVRAVRFVLFGEHEHRLEDGWITRGEKEGGVTLELSDGMLLKRTRKLGKATQVYCQGAMGDEAQARLTNEIGLSREDFEATCYFAQGEMASHVRMKPEPRFAIVAGWVGLGKLEAAEEHNRTALRGALQECARFADQVRGAEAALVECGDASDDKVTALEKHVAVQAARVQEAERVFKVAEEQLWRRKLEEELLTIQKQLDDMPPEDADAVKVLCDVKAQASEISTAWSVAHQEEKQKRVLARGRFDGVCPVASMSCPATDLINARVDENAALHAVAKDAADNALKLHEVTQARLRVAETRHLAEVQAEARAKTLEERATALQVKLARIPRIEVDYGAADLAKTRARDDLAAARTQLEVAAVALGRRAEAERRLQDARQGLRGAEAGLGPFKEAAAILGRSGAQRVAAEGALSEIEAGANARLQRCGVGLSVRVSWDREGAGLARACGACGEPYPKSEKVKTCPRCGEERGPHVVQKLEYELSNRSGAADDMVGIAIRLAASEWLRRQRGAAWSVALIDEPMGQLDAAHRRAVGQQLGQMLASEFEQSFVISHSSRDADMLSGRIEVVGGEDSSTVRVVA